jgi:predicted secreted protein
MKHLKDLVKTTCINDSHFPNEIKSINRPKKGQEYTIIATARMIITNELGFKLAEIDTECPEYPYYKATRFAISQEDLDKLTVHEEIVLEDIFEKELTMI